MEADHMRRFLLYHREVGNRQRCPQGQQHGVTYKSKPEERCC